MSKTKGKSRWVESLRELAPAAWDSNRLRWNVRVSGSCWKESCLVNGWRCPSSHESQESGFPNRSAEVNVVSVSWRVASEGEIWSEMSKNGS